MKKTWKYLLSASVITIILLAIILLKNLPLLREKATTDTPQVDDLRQDSGISTEPLTFTEKLDLIAQYDDDLSSLTVITEDITFEDDRQAAQKLLQAELDLLFSSDMIPDFFSSLLEKGLDDADIQHIKLKDNDRPDEADFFRFSDSNIILGYEYEVILEEEGGYIVCAMLDHPLLAKVLPEPLVVGYSFLDRFGIEYEIGAYDDSAAYFIIEGDIYYLITEDEGQISIYPTKKQVDPVTDSDGEARKNQGISI